MGDDLVRRGRAPLAEVLGGVRVADERRVVAAGDSAVQRRADALVGLRPRRRSAARPCVRPAPPRGRCPRRSPRSACAPRFGVARHQLGHEAPAVAAIGSSSTECCTHTTGTSSARALSTSARCWRRRVAVCAPAITPFWTSMTSRAVFGRSGRVVMVLSADSVPADGCSGPSTFGTTPDRSAQPATLMLWTRDPVSTASTSARRSVSRLAVAAVAAVAAIAAIAAIAAVTAVAVAAAAQALAALAGTRVGVLAGAADLARAAHQQPAEAAGHRGAPLRRRRRRLPAGRRRGPGRVARRDRGVSRLVGRGRRSWPGWPAARNARRWRCAARAPGARARAARRRTTRRAARG